MASSEPSRSSQDGSRRPQDPPGTWSSLRLFKRARDGNSSALNLLFQRNLGPILKWARGRLPRWARTAADTADIVQDAMLKTFRRLNAIEVRGPHALQAYLRQAVQNRINDEMRLVGRRGVSSELGHDLAASGPSALDSVLTAETSDRYKAALKRLRRRDRELIVGRFELGFSYEQLALAFGRASGEAARVALNRAVLRLTEEIKHE